MDINSLLSPQDAPVRSNRAAAGQAPRQQAARPAEPISSSSSQAQNAANSYSYSSRKKEVPAPTSFGQQQPLLNSQRENHVSGNNTNNHLPPTNKHLPTYSSSQTPPTSSRTAVAHSSHTSLPHHQQQQTQQQPQFHHPQSAQVRQQSPTSLPTSQSQQSHSLPSPPIQLSVGSTFAQPSVNVRSPSLSTPISNPSPLRRNASTERMEFLANLAAMQQQSQASKLSPRSTQLRTQDVMSTSPSTKTPPSLSRRNSANRSLAENPISIKPTPPISAGDYYATSLSSADLKEISSFAGKIQEDPHNLYFHNQLFLLLHKGFIAHVQSSDTDGHPENPNTYELLSELRQARNAFASRFAINEDLWKSWIHEDVILAASVEDHVAVMELFQKATRLEKGSSKLWRMYGDWMRHCHNRVNGSSQAERSNTLEQDPIVGPIILKRAWSEEDKAVASELFGWPNVLDIWDQAREATQHHISNNNLVFDPYMEILQSNLKSQSTPQRVGFVNDLFVQRLKAPHVTWDTTCRDYSQFVHKHNEFKEEECERIMNKVLQDAKSAKKQYEIRSEFEFKLQKAISAGNQEIERSVMKDYLDMEYSLYEKNHKLRSQVDLFIGLSERSNLRFPWDVEFWEDHVDLIIQEKKDDPNALIAITQRATRHCPWSGNLWSKHLYALEGAGATFEDLEVAQISATRSGMLEEINQGIEELIKVYTAWCGILRRKAFEPTATDDDRDVAEMSIRSAIENVKTVGENTWKKWGQTFKGDPAFRIERIYHKFLAQTGRIEDCRKSWKHLTTTHGDLMDFWYSYYLWEMIIWGKELVRTRTINQGKSTSKPLPPPYEATQVLRLAARRPNLDWPEKILDMYIHHCSQHESAEVLKEALVTCRRLQKKLYERRQQEAAQLAAAQAHAQILPQVQSDVIMQDVADSVGQVKRKRDDSPLTKGANAVKKSRAEVPAVTDAMSEDTTELTRDREHSTVMLRNLAAETDERDIRKLFQGFGRITVQVQTGANEERFATVVFENEKDATAAQSRSTRSLNGRTIEFHTGEDTTLWVTNYPPEFGEQEIRDLFSKHGGTIVGVRFPSLALNSSRRFCYVQFLSSEQARVASEKLHNVALKGDSRLVVKISKPQNKHARRGALYEGREVYVGRLDYAGTEDDIRNMFEKFGEIERIRIPRNLNGKSKGSAFVDFKTKEQANEALKMNHEIFNNRALLVEITDPSHGKKSVAKTILERSTTPGGSPLSPLPSSDGGNEDPAGNRALSPDVELAGGSTRENGSGGSSVSARTLHLSNIPDTVHQARIQKLCEQQGPLKKVVLKSDKGQAYIEFVSEANMATASLKLDGFEIEPGHALRVNMEPKYMTQKHIRRGHAPGINAGGRQDGKLGVGYKGATSNGRTNGTASANANVTEEAVVTKKNNADFAAMFKDMTGKEQ